MRSRLEVTAVELIVPFKQRYKIIMSNLEQTFETEGSTSKELGWMRNSQALMQRDKVNY